MRRRTRAFTCSGSTAWTTLQISSKESGSLASADPSDRIAGQHLHGLFILVSQPLEDVEQLFADERYPDERLAVAKVAKRFVKLSPVKVGLLQVGPYRRGRQRRIVEEFKDVLESRCDV